MPNSSSEFQEKEDIVIPSNSKDEQRSKLVRFKVPYVTSTTTQKTPLHTTLSTITQRTRVNFNFTPRNFTSLILHRPKNKENHLLKEDESNIKLKPTGVPYVYADKTTKE